MLYKNLLTESIIKIPESIKVPAIQILASTYIASANAGIDKLSNPAVLQYLWNIPANEADRGEEHKQKYEQAVKTVEVLKTFVKDLSAKYNVDPDDRDLANKNINVDFDKNRCLDELTAIYRLDIGNTSKVYQILKRASLSIKTKFTFNGGAVCSIYQHSDPLKVSAVITMNSSIDSYIHEIDIKNIRTNWVESYGELMHELQHFLQNIVLKRVFNDTKQVDKTYTATDDGSTPNGQQLDDYLSSPNEFPAWIVSTMTRIVANYLRTDRKVPITEFTKTQLQEPNKFLSVLKKTDINKYKKAIKTIYNRVEDYVNNVSLTDQLADFTGIGKFSATKKINYLSTILSLLNTKKSTIKSLINVTAHGDDINTLADVFFVVSGTGCDDDEITATIKLEPAIHQGQNYQMFDVLVKIDGEKEYNEFNDIPGQILLGKLYTLLTDLQYDMVDTAIERFINHFDRLANRSNLRNFDWVAGLVGGDNTFDLENKIVFIKSLGMKLQLAAYGNDDEALIEVEMTADGVEGSATKYMSVSKLYELICLLTNKNLTYTSSEIISLFNETLGSQSPIRKLSNAIKPNE